VYLEVYLLVQAHQYTSLSEDQADSSCCVNQNPAVSLGLVLVGGITPLRGAILTVAQLAGGIAAVSYEPVCTRTKERKADSLVMVLSSRQAGLTTGLLGTVDASTTLRPGTSIARGLFLEMFLTVSSLVKDDRQL
jgi:glycerol uptake facilitator-like aquaporin